MAHSFTPLVEQTRNEVRQVRDWLLRPTADTMSACVPALEHAIRCLREASALDLSGLPSSPGADTAALLTDEIRQVQALFEAAGTLYFAAMRRVSSSRAADLPPGQPAEPLFTLG